MIKQTVIFTPHEDKVYASTEAFWSENGYDDYKSNFMTYLSESGIDTSDANKYQEALTSDSKKCKATIDWADEDEKDRVMGVMDTDEQPFVDDVRWTDAAETYMSTLDSDKIPLSTEDSSDHIPMSSDFIDGIIDWEVDGVDDSNNPFL